MNILFVQTNAVGQLMPLPGIREVVDFAHAAVYLARHNTMTPDYVCCFLRMYGPSARTSTPVDV